MKFFSRIVFLFLILLGFTGCKKNVAALTVNPEAEKITVLPVNNIPDGFIMGVDISSLASVETSGVRFSDAEGKISDPIALLKAGGANTVRLRVWNNPRTEDRKSYGGGSNDIDVACALGKRAADYGMGVIIAFHYSDFWADSKRQTPPKAWENLRLDEKQAEIKKFTKESLAKLKKAGVKVKMVQIGNEINNGFCGEVHDQLVCMLLKAGCEAVREFDKRIKIAVHFTDPVMESHLEAKALMLEKNNIDYDVFGVSYFPYWHGEAKNLSMVLRKIANFYNKKVMVLETAFPFTEKDGDGYENTVSASAQGMEFNYPLSVEGQAIAVRDVIEAVAKLSSSGIGVCYWEPAWIPPKHFELSKIAADVVRDYNQNCWEICGSGWANYSASEYDKSVTEKVNGGKWDNQAFFDFDGKVLDSINVWNYARYGSYGKRAVVRVYSPVVGFEKNKENKLPSKVKVRYNDGSSMYETVEWDMQRINQILKNPAFGEYKVNGKTKNGDDVTCTVNIIGSNLLVNGNFEKGNLDGWNVSNPSGKGKPEVVRNYENAKQGLFYATGWDAKSFDFTLWQEIKNLEKGTYKCYGFFEGTGVKNPSGTCLKVEVKKKNGKIETFKANATIPNQWKKFDRVEIPSIPVDASVESVKVKICMSAEYSKVGKGAWLVCDDVNFLLVK